MEQQIDQKVDELELGVSDSSFDSGEKPEDESDPDYDLSRDCSVVSGVDLSRLHFHPRIYTVWLD